MGVVDRENKGGGGENNPPSRIDSKGNARNISNSEEKKKKNKKNKKNKSNPKCVSNNDGPSTISNEKHGDGKGGARNTSNSEEEKKQKKKKNNIAKCVPNNDGPSRKSNEKDGDGRGSARNTSDSEEEKKQKQKKKKKEKKARYRKNVKKRKAGILLSDESSRDADDHPFSGTDIGNIGTATAGKKKIVGVGGAHSEAAFDICKSVGAEQKAAGLTTGEAVSKYTGASVPVDEGCGDVAVADCPVVESENMDVDGALLDADAIAVKAEYASTAVALEQEPDAEDEKMENLRELVEKVVGSNLGLVSPIDCGYGDRCVMNGTPLVEGSTVCRICMHGYHTVCGGGGRCSSCSDKVAAVIDAMESVPVGFDIPRRECELLNDDSLLVEAAKQFVYATVDEGKRKDSKGRLICGNPECKQQHIDSTASGEDPGQSSTRACQVCRFFFHDGCLDYGPICHRCEKSIEDRANFVRIAYAEGSLWRLATARKRLHIRDDGSGDEFSGFEDDSLHGQQGKKIDGKVAGHNEVGVCAVADDENSVSNCKHTDRNNNDTENREMMVETGSMEEENAASTILQLSGRLQEETIVVPREQTENAENARTEDENDDPEVRPFDGSDVDFSDSEKDNTPMLADVVQRPVQHAGWKPRVFSTRDDTPFDADGVCIDDALKPRHKRRKVKHRVPTNEDVVGGTERAQQTQLMEDVRAMDAKLSKLDAEYFDGVLNRSNFSDQIEKCSDSKQPYCDRAFQKVLSKRYNTIDSASAQLFDKCKTKPSARVVDEEEVRKIRWEPPIKGADDCGTFQVYFGRSLQMRKEGQSGHVEEGCSVKWLKSFLSIGFVNACIDYGKKANSKGWNQPAFLVPLGDSNSDIAPLKCYFRSWIDNHKRRRQVPALRFVQDEDSPFCLGYSVANALYSLGLKQQAEEIYRKSEAISEKDAYKQVKAIVGLLNRQKSRLESLRGASLNGVTRHMGSSGIPLCIAELQKHDFVIFVPSCMDDTNTHALTYVNGHMFKSRQGYPPAGVIFDATQPYPLMLIKETFDFAGGSVGFDRIFLSKIFRWVGNPKK